MINNMHELQWEQNDYLYECDECAYIPQPGDILYLEKLTSTRALCPQCKTKGIGITGKPETKDPIGLPEHYIFGPYEVRPVLLEWIKCSGIPADEAADWFSMMQYLMRYTRKGKPKRDLLKARKYLDWLVERYE